MSSQPQSPSLVVRFLDSFLQERNIKWILAVGMAILLGSSLLLVNSNWDRYTPLWQDLIVLGYSAAIHAAGQWTYHRLGLRRTGTVLQGLTVALIPILFRVIHWMPEDVPGLWDGQAALFLATAAFGSLAARRIFAFFLRSTQPTFLVCYLILAISGTLLPALDPAAATWAVAFLWTTFAVGALKVSRHVFWLTEENRAPRIFGFFPIALLGGQFLFLYWAHPALHVDLAWLGFGCLLVAIPILGTADAIAAVFQKRTGDLVRPLPWAIVLPVIVGLLLCATGVVLSGVSLVPPSRPHALVVTAAVAAGLMALMARRTGKQAFVWAMLVGLTLAYNFSPMFFMDIVQAIKARGATMVRESRLPFAFYGLTYLPLLLVLTFASQRARRIGSDLFAMPTKHCAFGLTCLLWALSLTHEKAIFPVGLCLVAIAVLQAKALRSWPAVVLALTAWISAAQGLPVFAEKVLELPAFANAQTNCLVAAAGVLLLVGRIFDERIGRLFPASIAPRTRHLCQLTSGGLFAAIATMSLGTFDWPMRVAGLLSVAGLGLAVRQRRGDARILFGILLNLHALMALVQFIRPASEWSRLYFESDDFGQLVLPLASASAFSLLVWRFAARFIPPNVNDNPLDEFCQFAAALARCALRGLWIVCLARSLTLGELSTINVALAMAAFAMMAVDEIVAACRENNEGRVWIGEAIFGVGILYAIFFRVVVLHSGFGIFALLGLAVVLGLLRQSIDGRPGLAALARPLGLTSFYLPLVSVAVGIARHLSGQHVEWLGLNSLALLFAAAFYFWRGLDEGRKNLHILAAVILYIALVLLWNDLKWTDPQFFMVPIGISALVFVELLKREIPERFHNPLRYAGALVILVSPTFSIVAGSWVHLFTLMVASVAIVLLAIGLRTRALLYTGTAFLLADLIAIVVQGSRENPNVLWAAGLTLGAGIIALGAYCEKHRERLQSRMHLLASTLKTWA